MTIIGNLIGNGAAATLLSAASASVVVSLLAGEFDAQGLMKNVISAGGPIAIGAAIGNYAWPPEGKTEDKQLPRIAVGTAATLGLLIFAGVMPASLDAETLTFGGLAAFSIWVGDAYVMSGLP